MNNVKTLKALILTNAMYFRESLPDEVIAMYAGDLLDLPLDAVRLAYERVRRDPKVRRMPLPAEIRELIQPARVSDEDQAREAAARILGAISRYGWNNIERARDYVGELGWSVVQAQGGWRQLCEQVTEDQIGTYQAQWRDLAASHMRRSRAGQLHLAPELPQPVNQQLETLISKATRKLPVYEPPGEGA